MHQVSANEFVDGGLLSQRQNEYSAFVQDKWEVNSRFTVDAGLPI
jgi:hypothetical protein